MHADVPVLEATARRNCVSHFPLHSLPPYTKSNPLFRHLRFCPPPVRRNSSIAMSNRTTFSSSLLNQIFLSIDSDPPTPPSTKMPSLRRTRLVHKWMEKPSFDDLIVPPPPPPRHRPSPPPPPAIVSVDEDPDSFFSTTSVSSSDSSFASTASEAETPSFDSSSKPKTSCFGPLRAPKPVKTKPKAPNNDRFHEDCSTNKSSSSSSSSRALKIYSQLKSLKQPISPGIKLAKYINSLFIKEASATSTNKKGKFRGVPAPEKTSRHFAKREVQTPIAPDRKEALIKRYEELRRMNIGEIEVEQEEEQVDMNRKVLEEVALDLLNSYWNRRKTENNEEDDNDKDDSSCSSSDLFEIDHLSLIGNEELPVYETTQIRS